MRMFRKLKNSYITFFLILIKIKDSKVQNGADGRFGMVGTPQNFLNCFLAAADLVTLITLKRTVLDRGRHSPTVITSPMAMSLKQGDTWAEMFLCLFFKPLVLLDEVKV